MVTPNFVAYYRVSTKGQGESNLGFEAQQYAVEEVVNARGGRIISSFKEVESGARNDRPELLAAIDECKLYSTPGNPCVLIIAKLDRLSRSAAFLTMLQESDVKFICADLPEADDMMIGILALVARWERQKIGQRTREALAARKARGEPHKGYRAPKGKPLSEAARQASVASRQAKAIERAERYRRTFEQLHDEGYVTYQPMATELTARGIPVPSGKGSTWYPAQVQRVMERLRDGS